MPVSDLDGESCGATMGCASSVSTCPFAVSSMPTVLGPDVLEFGVLGSDSLVTGGEPRTTFDATKLAEFCSADHTKMAPSFTHSFHRKNRTMAIV